LEAEGKYEAARAQLQLLRLVETRLGSDLNSEFVGRAEEIVTEHLRPALDKILKKAGKLAPKLGGAITPDALLRSADEGARKASVELGEDLFQRYVAIRSAYGLVYSGAFKDEVGISDLDLHDLLAYRNFDQLPKQQGRVATPPTPVQLMVWLVSDSEGIRPEPWLPLPHDVEDAIEAARRRVRDQQVGGWQAAQQRTAAAKAREAAEQEQRDKATKSAWGQRASQ
jgi:hypothetical protein